MAGRDERAAERPSGLAKHTADELLDAFNAGFDTAIVRVFDFLMGDIESVPTVEEVTEFVRGLLTGGRNK